MSTVSHAIFDEYGVKSDTDDLNPLPPKRVHLPFLDGLRGLAALYVACYHALQPSNWQTPSEHMPLWTWPFRFGPFAVGVFIVLSGFVLMLPVAQYGGLKNGLKDFVLRRAKRILPPYYISLIFSLLIAYFGLHYSSKLGNIIMHILLLHNTRIEWNMAINGAMWSVATEWQIYFAFALILLPIWKKYGLKTTVLSACVIGLVPHFLFPYSHNLDWARPWYLGLFSLGMVSAVACQSRKNYFANPYTALTFAATLVAGCCFYPGATGNYLPKWTWAIDILIGTSTSIGIIACAQPVAAQRLVSFLQHSIFMRLGAFSYSLYLFHQPVLSLFSQAFRSLPISYNTFEILMAFVSLPVSIAVSYLFYLLAEKRFAGLPKSSVLP